MEIETETIQSEVITEIQLEFEITTTCEVTEPVQVEDIQVTEISDLISSTFSELETGESVSETSEITSETTYNYISEIASNTSKTATCISYFSGLSIIAITIFLCVVVVKVFYGGNDY